MKKKLTHFILAGAVALVLVSCSSMESDAKKVAKRAYEIEKVYKSLDDRSNLGGSRASKEKKINDYVGFALKMSEKYGKDQQTREKFDRLVRDELAKLKNE